MPVNGSSRRISARLARQTAGDLQPPPFAAGERRSDLPPLVIEAELAEQPIDLQLALLAAHVEIFEDRRDVLLDGELAKDAVVLRQIAHAEPGPLVHGPIASRPCRPGGRVPSSAQSVRRPCGTTSSCRHRWGRAGPRSRRGPHKSRHCRRPAYRDSPSRVRCIRASAMLVLHDRRGPSAHYYRIRCMR